MNPAHQTPAPVAVLLVAGVGERLRPLTLHTPKALVDVGGDTMLGRSLRLLIEHGVEEVVLATGFAEAAVRAATRELSVPVRLCPNAEYATTQNGMSLLACEEAVAGRDFYKLDGDVLYRREVLERLDAAGEPLSVAVDRGGDLGAEEMKVQISDDRTIRAFGKQLEPASCAGESIGIERVSGVAVSLLFHGLAQARDAGQTHLYYEDVYSVLIERGLRAGMVDVTDLPWTEVDTMDDLERARQMVRLGQL